MYHPIKNIGSYITLLFILLIAGSPGFAQQQHKTVSLSQAIDAALQHNHQLKIKAYQVQEKQVDVKKAKVKRYPSVIINSTYRYNENIGSLEIPKGSFGSLPLNSRVTIPLPGEDKTFSLGERENFNAGVTFYQPLSQQAKIGTGVNLAQKDVTVTSAENEQAKQQITLALEQLFFGLLINDKKQDKAETDFELAKLKLRDVESAIEAGKTVGASKTALQAKVSDKKQALLKLKIKAEDYASDFENLTGISLTHFDLQEVKQDTSIISPLDHYKSEAAVHNTDLNLASLKQQKSKLAIKAAKESYLPDLGLIAGYMYQKGNTIYPKYNPYVGVNFKWDLQDLFSNRQVVNQRKWLYRQALENCLNTQEQVQNKVEKAYRKLRQLKALIKAAREAVGYRREAYQIQQNQADAGLNTQSDLLEAHASLAKSEADLYAAQLQYRLALSKLNMLSTGKINIK